MYYFNSFGRQVSRVDRTKTSICPKKLFIRITNQRKLVEVISKVKSSKFQQIRRIERLKKNRWSENTETSALTIIHRE